MASGARPSGAVYGIDLGTTYSCLAGVGVNGSAEVVPLLDGSLTLPSVVLFVGADDYVTGEPARMLARAQPDDVCMLVKRRMGDGEWRFVSHGRSWSAPAVSSLVLKALVSETAFSTGQVTDVVITVPAYFGDEERRATQLAGEYAGLNVLDVINEPTAAALSYGFARLSGPSTAPYEPGDGAEEVALVFDLGGGTVDVTVVELADRRLAVVAIDGDHELGGADWDEKLAVHLSRAFTAAHSDAEDPLDDSAGAQALVLSAERAKRQLTEQDSVVVPVEHDGRQVEVRVTRAEFERQTAGLLDRTVALTRSAVAAARERGIARIDRVLLVGGSSRMPAVARRLSEELGVQAELHDPDLAVARGAAVYGRKKSLERLLTAIWSPAASSSTATRSTWLRPRTSRPPASGLPMPSTCRPWRSGAPSTCRCSTFARAASAYWPWIATARRAPSFSCTATIGCRSRSAAASGRCATTRTS